LIRTDIGFNPLVAEVLFVYGFRRATANRSGCWAESASYCSA
jgi:hypothetical protein